MNSSELTGQDWERPGVFEVAPGVHRVPLPLPHDSLHAVNVYVLVEGASVTLIDAGWQKPESRERLEAGLRELDLGLSDIDRFLVTHVHRDHYTLGVAIRREFGTHLSLGLGEKPVLEVHMSGRAPIEGQLEFMRHCGAEELADKMMSDPYLNEPQVKGIWEVPDTWLEPGEVQLGAGRTLDVVETPGHTRGHVVFHDGDRRLLFAGDHVLPRITPSIGFEPVLSPDPLGAYLGSLARVRALPDALLLPAHGPVAPSVHARVDALLEHHSSRLDLTEKALAEGAATPRDVATLLRWTPKERKLEELDVFNQLLAIGETRAHLVVLVSQGRAVCEAGDDGVSNYLAT
jgi:glyoxylase-like metal-dependent hydrolase (beta-lactamase superfamily II)